MHRRGTSQEMARESAETAAKRFSELPVVDVSDGAQDGIEQVSSQLIILELACWRAAMDQTTQRYMK